MIELLKAEEDIELLKEYTEVLKDYNRTCGDDGLTDFERNNYSRLKALGVL